MNYKAKSAVVARKKVKEETYDCIVNLFDLNDPHLSPKAPKECLEFQCSDVILKNLTIKYLPLGNDLIINNLTEISIEQKGKTVVISGKQTQ